MLSILYPSCQIPTSVILQVIMSKIHNFKISEFCTSLIDVDLETHPNCLVVPILTQTVVICSQSCTQYFRTTGPLVAVKNAFVPSGDTVPSGGKTL